MDTRAALDAIYDYIKAKDSADLLTDFYDENDGQSPLLAIEKRFKDALEG